MEPVVFGVYRTAIVQVRPGFTTAPFTQLPPVMVKGPVFAPPDSFAIEGAAVNVSAPVPLLVTVIVLFLTAVVAGVVTIDGLGAEKATTALASPVPASVTAEPVTGTLAVMVT